MEPEYANLKLDDVNLPLGQISTVWTMVSRAHGGPRVAEADAQKSFMERYYGAVYRYFLAALRDPDAAQELFQEFAERFLRGSFARFDPAKGRFRDYLRMALRNMIRDHCKRQTSRSHVDLAEIPEPTAHTVDQPDALHDEFLHSWRAEILTRAWDALRNEKRRSGLPFHIVLERNMQSPDNTSDELACELTAVLKPPKRFSGPLVRKTLQLARQRYADLLVREVAQSLGNHTVEQLEQELIDLGLIGYCREALELRWIIGS